MVKVLELQWAVVEGQWTEGSKDVFNVNEFTLGFCNLYLSHFYKDQKAPK